MKYFLATEAILFHCTVATKFTTINRSSLSIKNNWQKARDSCLFFM